MLVWFLPNCPLVLWTMNFSPNIFLSTKQSPGWQNPPKRQDLNRSTLQCGLNPSCKFFLTCLGYWPETFHTLIKLTPRVTLPQILGRWPIIQNLKNDPIFVWELLFGYKSVMVTPTNTLWGWFGGPPGVLQMTHPMGPSTDAYGYRRSKRAKTHSTSKPKMTLAEPNDWAQDAICCRFWTKNSFETLSRVGIS